MTSEILIYQEGELERDVKRQVKFYKLAPILSADHYVNSKKGVAA